MLSRVLTRGAAAVSITAAIAAVGSSFLYYRWFRPSGSSPAGSMAAAHAKALTSPYPGSQVQRRPVPPEKISWAADWPEYDPVDYTAPYVLTNPPWADPLLGSEGFSPQFNALDGAVQRESLQGTYSVVGGVPRNPVGRTGVKGRGLLGRWGPNHAADPLITRWKQDSDGRRVTDKGTGKPILQFVAIQRKDCGQWAIPGIYRGYVDDPRNTDNSWMETQAVNYHDETGHLLSQIRLEAGDDAGKVQWVDVSGDCSLYANHARFIHILAQKRGAHW
ncbi:ADP-ribose pyrophosphatase, mitochondrial isoform X4 [Xenopus tropicalis]|uniref:ADP-ribose pyrophosphatase, mitochondrial isoform X4 n=1 Tax=Xenopus tropicalis TaxID=8364 RepID=A0A8J1ITA2_XENTR|nr:ADP-ribose pyrophosphatase, mitochondrial isoform X4 [Xenopus tropicalis]